MGCNCKWMEIIISLVILVFTFWMTTVSKWIVVIAAIALFLHALMCKNCHISHGMDSEKGSMATSKKSSRKRR